ncbi:hypothetical protein [Parasitella parasitica]|uniref:Uncharacterized protein n=1 Tax=Parasitella parasitica TaxID=35722 RepID=A0A0B7NFK5_9FUNG|nr:hypothetical protein [Parasitella parasitica]
MASQFYWRAGSLLGDNPTKIKNWATAAHFQIIHGVALLAFSSIPPAVRRIRPAAQPLILGGTFMFSGTMYLLTLNKEKFRSFGPVTP